MDYEVVKLKLKEILGDYSVKSMRCSLELPLVFFNNSGFDLYVQITYFSKKYEVRVCDTLLKYICVHRLSSFEKVCEYLEEIYADRFL